MPWQSSLMVHSTGTGTARYITHLSSCPDLSYVEEGTVVAVARQQLVCSLAGTGRALCIGRSDLLNRAITECSHDVQHLTRLTGPRVFLKRSLLSSSKRARVRGSERSTPSARDSISTRTWGVEDKYYSAGKEAAAEGKSGAPMQRLPPVLEDHLGTRTSWEWGGHKPETVVQLLLDSTKVQKAAARRGSSGTTRS